MARGETINAIVILIFSIATAIIYPSPADAHRGDVHLTVTPPCLAVTDESPTASHDKTFRVNNNCGADIVVTDLSTPDPQEDGLSIMPRPIAIKKRGSNEFIQFKNKGWTRLRSVEVDEVGKDCSKLTPNKDDICSKFLLPAYSYLQITWDKWSIKGFIKNKSHTAITIQVLTEPETFN